MEPPSYNLSRVWSTAFHAGIGGFIMGYNIGVFTSCQPCIASVLNWGSSSTIWIPIMTALNFLGGFFGALFSGSLKSFGRRKSIMLADWITICGSIIVIFPFTFTFGIGRFALGFASGMFNSLCPLYVNEKTPIEVSGKVGTLYQVYACIGVLAAYAMALPLPTGDYDHNVMTYWWMVIFSSQLILALLQFFLFKKVFRLDTPTSLIDRGLDSKALRSMCEVFPKDEALLRLSVGFSESSFANKMSPTNEVKKIEHSYAQLLFCKGGRGKMIRIGIMASFVQEFSGIIPILAYLTFIFDDFGGGVFLSRGLTTVSGLVKLLSVMAVLPYVDKWGRRPIFIYGSISMGIFMGLVGVFNLFAEVSYFVPFVLIECFLIAFEFTAGPLCWIYSGEILCPKGMSIAISFNWLFMTITALSFPFLLQIFGIGFTFLGYCAINLLCALYCWVDFIETKGLDKNTIQASLFGHKH